jgi:uncharacterized coiled-coil protein SlyX
MLTRDELDHYLITAQPPDVQRLMHHIAHQEDRIAALTGQCDELTDRLNAAESQLSGERLVWSEMMTTHAFEKRKLTERAVRAEERIAALEAALRQAIWTQSLAKPGIDVCRDCGCVVGFDHDPQCELGHLARLAALGS